MKEYLKLEKRWLNAREDEKIIVTEEEMKEIYKLEKQLDIANKKLEKIEEHCNKSIEYEEREIKMLSEQHNKFDHLRIIRNNNEILKIIGGE